MASSIAQVRCGSTEIGIGSDIMVNVTSFYNDTGCSGCCGCSYSCDTTSVVHAATPTTCVTLPAMDVLAVHKALGDL